MTEKEIIIKGLKTNYKVFDGSRVGGQISESMLILHGWGSNSDRWQQVSDELFSKFTVVVPDIPGFGKSDVPKEAWCLDNYVEWLLEFTNNVPELSSEFSLLGHSFGGALASKYSIKYAQKVKKLFLVSAAIVRKNAGVKKILYKIAKTVKIFSFLPLYSQFRKAVYKFIIRKSDYTYQNGIMKETYLKIILEDLSYKIGFIKVPVVIIWGDKDTSTPYDQATFINKRIFNSKLFVISGAEHALNTKFPKELSQNILNNA
ncbi:MAG: alpha/beta hydrolase [Candidatus Staskawiczbacteria bacterium]|nr:alpha/beta hydrolase [Candidatus Staskawiczbacteria bacterium]